MFVQDEIKQQTTMLNRIGAIIKRARQNKRLTQIELAELVGISRRHVLAIEKGDNYPGLETLYLLIHALGISADQIFRPESVNRSIEDDLLIHTILSCSEKNRRIVNRSVLSLIQTLEEETV